MSLIHSLLLALSLAVPAAAAANPKSCANWSEAYDVGASYCTTTKAPVCGEPVGWFKVVTMQRTEQFRWCWYSDGSSFKETQSGVRMANECGCGY